MARATLTKTTPLGSKSSLYTANAADITFAAANVSDKNQFVASGKDLVLAWNSNPTNPYTVTITSVADPTYGRTGDITTYSLAAGEIACFGPLVLEGWSQTDGKIYLEASNAAIKFAVLTLS